MHPPEAPKLHDAMLRIRGQMARGEMTEEVGYASSLRPAVRKSQEGFAEDFCQNWLHFW